MSDNAMVAIILCAAISSCTACSVSSDYAASKRAEMTPEQLCVATSTFDSTKLDCLKKK